MQIRLSRIDELTRPDHTFLEPSDDCYYLGEYTARAGYAFSATNDLIQNLKKPMDRRGRPEWRYKTWAINEAARMLRNVVPEACVGESNLRSRAPSKVRDETDYDDRLVQILQRFGHGRTVDIRELVLMTESIDAAHLTGDPRNIPELIKRLSIDRSLRKPLPEAICIFDDVLTTGAHFKAVQSILQGEFPRVPLAGLFLARRAPQASPI